jgi:pyridoxal phosphate enzyme (YggS family)
MSELIQRYENIISSIKSKLENKNYTTFPKVIAVSKTFKLEKILPLIDYGHLDFGENKVQEAIEKWTKIKEKRSDLKLHLIGKLQTNKVKFALKIFDYVHSLDSKKLAKKIADEQIKQNKKIKFFIQVNIGEEDQKNGVSSEDLFELYNYCKQLDLNVIGLMCIPPVNQSSENFFDKMKILKEKLELEHLSMGMSSDYLKAVEFDSSFLRIGSNIFGRRS